MKYGLLLPIAVFLCGPIALAQTPYLLRVEPPPGLFHSDMLFDRIGTDLYRIAGTLTGPDTAWFYQARVDAVGTVQNATMLRCDSGSAGQYPSVLLPTADGGLLFSYLNATNGTDKQTFAKLDASGAVEWARHYPDNYGIFLNDHPTAMVEKNGHYFVLGHRQDVAPNVGWSSTMLEVDSVGACVQLHTWADGDALSDLGRGLMRTADNGLYSVFVQRPYFGQSSYPSVSVQRWDASLQVAWSYRYALGNYHFQNHALLLQDGGLLLSGQVRFTSGSAPFRPYFMRLDSTGQVVWSRVVLDTQLSPKAAVEEADGSFTLLLYSNTAQLMLVHLDASGALLSAIGPDALPTSAFPADLVRDGASGEHLVRGRVTVPGNPTYLARLDANGEYACGVQQLTWTDSLVTPTRTAFPVTVTLSTLASMPIGWTTAPLTLTAVDVCLSTEVQAAEQKQEPACWPVPATEELFIALGQATGEPLPYSIHDATGRLALNGTATATEGGVVRLDVRGLARGAHVVVLHLPSGHRRAVMMK